LRFNVFGLLQGLIAYPFVPLLGVVGASNLVIILTIFLNGFLAYLLVNEHVRDPKSSLLAAVFNMLSIAVIWHFTVGRNALPAAWIISASLLCLKSVLESPSIWTGFVFGLSLLAALFTDLHVTAFTLMWVGAYLTQAVWKNNPVLLSRSHLIPVSISASLFALAVIAVLLPALPDLSDYPVPALDDAAQYSLSLSDFIVPRYIPNIYGFDFLIAVVLATILFRWQGEYRFWLVASLTFLVLALGPYLKPTQVPLPYALVSVWDPLQNFRTPYRFAIPATIGFTLVMGYALKQLLRKIPSRSVVMTLCAFLIICRTAYTIKIQPFRTQIYPTYEFYEKIAEEPDDYTILRSPLVFALD
jgi:hypothetical protein